MSPLESVKRSAKEGSSCLREAVLSVIHLRQLGKLKGHGLLSFSHKAEIIKQDIQDLNEWLLC